MMGIRRLALTFISSMLFTNISLKTDAGNIPKVIADTRVQAFERYTDSIYQAAGLREQGLDILPFKKALTGYYNIKAWDSTQIKLPIISVIDFTKKSVDKRLWVIDLAHAKVLFNTLVAHGKNTGEQYVAHFSNQASSNMSSLGFYLTAEIYTGKHGMSMALDGLEEGFNDNARKRAVVVHAADYVSEDFINKVGRLGRSQGCPAVPVELAPQIINAIANGSCLFIYYPDKNYEQTTSLLDESTAAVLFAHERGQKLAANTSGTRQ